MLLEAHNVAKAYGATPALIDAEFAIDAGEVVAASG
jgi:ABC-type sugar transport system ATPase subunit